MAKTSLSYKIFKDLIDKNPTGLSELGMTTYAELQSWYEAHDLMTQIDTILIAVNGLETIDPLLSAITREGEDGTFDEVYMVAKFTASNWDTMDETYKPVTRMYTVPFRTLGTAIAISERLYLVDQRRMVDIIINSVLPAYVRILRQLSLEALMLLPTDESSSLPCFWRDTSGFADVKNQFAPYPNGLKKFQNSESHYMAEAKLDKTSIRKLVKKVKSKGYGRNGLMVVANENLWEEYADLFTYDEIRKLDLVEVSDDFAPIRNKVTYVTLPETDFPDNYVLCIDPTVEGLYKKVPENEKLKGLFKGFSTFEDIKRTNYRAEFKIFETGYGISDKGFGAVMYLGGTDYVNPTLDIA